jgi:TPR repeat protein
VRRIPVAAALLFCLAAIHYFVISPWLHFSKVLSAAEEGNVPAQMEVALLYETGSGTWQSYPDALKWYATAAENGDMNAMFLLYGAVAAERVGDEDRIVLVPKGGRNELMGLLMMLGQAYQKGDADRPVSKGDLETFDRVSESAGGIRDYKADPLASAFLEKQAASGSEIAVMQLANVAGISEANSATAKTDAVDTELLSFLDNSASAAEFAQDASVIHVYEALRAVAVRLSTVEEQE